MKPRDLSANGLLLVGRTREFALLLINVEEVCEARGLPIESLKRAERLDVLAVGLVHSAIGLERVVD
ncbi:MAG: hypothetical protein ACREJX_05495, partial [Polyangiaceae bacterium]